MLHLDRSTVMTRASNRSHFYSAFAIAIRKEHDIVEETFWEPWSMGMKHRPQQSLIVWKIWSWFARETALIRPLSNSFNSCSNLWSTKINPRADSKRNSTLLQPPMNEKIYRVSANFSLGNQFIPFSRLPIGNFSDWGLFRLGTFPIGDFSLAWRSGKTANSSRQTWNSIIAGCSAVKRWDLCA